MSPQDPEGPIGPWVRPALTEVSASGGFGLGLRADTEQQQQQQQQQQNKASVRRFLDTETMMPMEEAVTTLTREIRQVSKLAPREK